jgi:hypothetical protein
VLTPRQPDVDRFGLHVEAIEGNAEGMGPQRLVAPWACDSRR